MQRQAKQQLGVISGCLRLLHEIHIVRIDNNNKMLSYRRETALQGAL